MSSRSELRDAVQFRAGHRCEYCLLPDTTLSSLGFHVEHILPRQHGGTDDLQNRAWSCRHCNLHKGPNLCGIDPESGVLARLYNPRAEEWSEHFRWSDLEIVGRTSVGQATVAVMKMNHPKRLELRAELRRLGQLPSSG